MSSLDTGVKSLYLEKEYIRIRKILPLAEADITSYVDETLNAAVLDISGYIWSSTVLDRRLVPIRIPLNWWEMFKRDHAPAWFKHKFPVKYEKTPDIEVAVKALFPEFTWTAPPGVGPHVIRYIVSNTRSFPGPEAFDE